MTVTRRQVRRLALAGAVLAASTACSQVSDRNGEPEAPDVRSSPGLDAVVPSAPAVTPQVTDTIFPTSTATPKRGNPPGGGG